MGSSSTSSFDKIEYEEEEAQVRVNGLLETPSSDSDDSDDDDGDRTGNGDGLPVPGWSNPEDQERILTHYLPLLIAVYGSDWDSASKFLEQEPDAVRARITHVAETALIVAARTSGRSYFVKNLLEKMSPKDLALCDTRGLTALHGAATTDNTEVVKLLVTKNPNLPNIANKQGRTPLYTAALCGNREIFLYLMEFSSEDIDPKQFKGEQGVAILYELANNGLYDIGLSLLQCYPQLARWQPSLPVAVPQARLSLCPLVAVVNSPFAFRSTAPSSFWHNLIYSMDTSSREFSWEVAERIVQKIKCIREQKLINHQALHLVKCLCKEMVKSNYTKAYKNFSEALFKATIAGIHEIVEEIFITYPVARSHLNQMGQNVFQIAIVHRRENVFNLVYQGEKYNRPYLARRDTSQNNSLHLAANLSPQQQLRLRAITSNAALQMQRELQWFKEVEKFVWPQEREYKNLRGQTPADVFTDTHKELVKEGERWMKDTAFYCTIVAALIAILVFMAAIAVPVGGSYIKSTHPILWKQKAFTIFFISDSVALFSCASSLMIFLSIYTSRFAEADFLYDLPHKLIMGLIALFFSITSMIVALASALYLMLGLEKEWGFILVILACVPIAISLALQFPLLLEMMKSTYGRGIFGKQSDRKLF